MVIRIELMLVGCASWFLWCLLFCTKPPRSETYLQPMIQVFYLFICKYFVLNLPWTLCAFPGGHEPEWGTQGTSARKGPKHQTRDGGAVHLRHSQICKSSQSWMKYRNARPQTPPDPSASRLASSSLVAHSPIWLSTLHAWLLHLWLQPWFHFFVIFIQSCQQSAVKDNQV